MRSKGAKGKANSGGSALNIAPAGRGNGLDTIRPYCPFESILVHSWHSLACAGAFDAKTYL